MADVENCGYVEVFAVLSLPFLFLYCSVICCTLVLTEPCLFLGILPFLQSLLFIPPHLLCLIS